MKKKKVVISMLTWCSLLLFILVIVTTSLTPLSHTSAGANEFNTVGMYAAIGLIAACYLIPYGLYVVGIEAIKYVMAVFCLFGCFIAVTTCLSIAVAMFWMSEPFYYFLLPFIVSFFMLCVNLVWFIAAFVHTKERGQVV